MKFILFKKKKKKSKTYCVRCACSVPEQNKKNPKFFWIAEGRDREPEKERERERKPKSWKPETVKPLLRSAKATTGHRQTVPHRTVHACWLLMPPPLPLGHATRRLPVRFCSQIWYVFVLFFFSFFFSSLSFPVLLLHYSWQPCLVAYCFVT